MKLSAVLLCLAGWSLSWAIPIRVDDNAPVPNDSDNRTMFEMITEANKEISVFLDGGDINIKRSRSVTRRSSFLWTKSNDGIVQVPFVLPDVYTDFERSMLNMVMKEFEMMTCVHFVNRTTEKDYLSIQSATGCWSYVGKMGGAQAVSLNMNSCIRYSLIQHELMHALGFYHEHTRSDRDQYIDVLWQNISPYDASDFYRDNGNTLNLSYGYNSVLHYDGNAYSNTSGQPSMISKSNPNMVLGQHVGMHDLDVMKINRAYNCNLCSRKFVETSGTFIFSSTTSSQGASKCLYLIQSLYKILLELSDVNFPSSPDCNDNYIKVYNGISNSSPVLLEKTCGSEPVPPLVSSGPFMLIEIVNNQQSAHSTFTASYQSVKHGGTFVSNNSIVKSPEFPFFYPLNLDIVYSIIAPKGYKVSLSFVFFWIQTSPTCSTEYLIVRDGALQTSPILGTYCGHILPLPPPLVSTGNVMVLRFHTGNVDQFNGFLANYQYVSATDVQNGTRTARSL